MKKNVVQDVIPPKKSIRNVELSDRARDYSSGINKISLTKTDFFKHGSKQKTQNADEPIKIQSANQDKPPGDILPPDYNYEFESPKRRSRILLYFAGTILALILLIAVSSFFKSAEIKITPQEKSKTLNEVFTAKKDASLNSLSFQVVSISKETEKAVEAKDTTGQEKVDKKAGGKIVIYNNYSIEPQKLVATTRFQTPEGLIFRIKEGVIVPGKSTKDGKIVPGNVEVYVEADKPGGTYNVGLKDFTIPGFKGDARYKEMYARSKTEMTGGFSGIQKTVAKDILGKSELEMEEALQPSLYNDLVKQIPKEFAFFTDSVSYKFDPVNQVVDTQGAIVLKKKGTATAVIFDKSNLSKAIQAKILIEAGDSLVKVSNIDKLTFSYTATSTILTSNTSSISFSLKGEPNFIWMFDENKLKNDLLGLSKKNAKAVIEVYPAIKEAWIIIKPFWNRTIPSNSNKVTLINTTESI